MLRQVEVRAAVDTLHLLEAERHLKLNVRGSIRIVRQFLVVVEAVFLIAKPQRLVPAEAELLPVLKPFQLLARANEELHLHLLELAHTEYELTRYYLVAECLTNLCDTERNLHATRLLHIQEVHEDTLCRLRAQVNLHRAVCRRAHLRLEHQVKLPHVRPVTRAADGAYDFLIKDNLLQRCQVVGVHRLGVTLMQGVTVLHMLFHALVGLLIEFLIKVLAEALAGLCQLLFDLLVYLRYLVFYQHISAIAFLRVAVVYQGVVEGIHMPARFPYRRVHEDSGINTHDILVQQRHRVPPVLLDVVLQFHAVLTIVIHSA